MIMIMSQLCINSYMLLKIGKNLNDWKDLYREKLDFVALMYWMKLHLVQ